MLLTEDCLTLWLRSPGPEDTGKLGWMQLSYPQAGNSLFKNIIYYRKLEVYQREHRAKNLHVSILNFNLILSQIVSFPPTLFLFVGLVCCYHFFVLQSFFLNFVKLILATLFSLQDLCFRPRIELMLLAEGCGDLTMDHQRSLSHSFP